jgi:hypothetical protein
MKSKAFVDQIKIKKHEKKVIDLYRSYCNRNQFGQCTGKNET